MVGLRYLIGNSPTNLLLTAAYLCFLYLSSSSVKTPLSSQLSNFVGIDFWLQCAFQRFVYSVFLESITLWVFLRGSSLHLFGSFHALVGFPTQLKHAGSPHWRSKACHGQQSMLGGVNEILRFFCFCLTPNGQQPVSQDLFDVISWTFLTWTVEILTNPHNLCRNPLH